MLIPDKFRSFLLVAVLAVLVPKVAPAQDSEVESPTSGRDAAKEQAQEAAKELVPLGFTMRGDSWSGEALEGAKVGVRHHLFKGNEYVFVLGSGLAAEIEFEVMTTARKPVPNEVTTDGQTATIRLNPPKTGTYLIVFSLKSEKEERIPWALVYGYR